LFENFGTVYVYLCLPVVQNKALLSYLYLIFKKSVCPDSCPWALGFFWVVSRDRNLYLRFDRGRRASVTGLSSTSLENSTEPAGYDRRKYFSIVCKSSGKAVLSVRHKKKNQIIEICQLNFDFGRKHIQIGRSVDSCLIR
jgi:hypothetical protein